MPDLVDVNRSLREEVERLDDLALAKARKGSDEPMEIRLAPQMTVDEFLEQIHAHAVVAKNGYEISLNAGVSPKEAKRRALFVVRTVAAYAVRCMIAHGVVVGRPPEPTKAD